MAGNVRVCARFRPMNARERAHGADRVVTIDGATILLSRAKYRAAEDTSAAPAAAAGTKTNTFTFDHVYDEKTTQQHVYTTAITPLVQEIFTGYNATIFAYGQTGSGKTHTMMGEPESDAGMGIIPRLVASIFDGIEGADPEIEFSLKITYVEIYNERVRDLLDSTKDNLQIRETKQQGVWIRDATEKYVGSYDQVLDVMAAGTENRAIASTQMNLDSSRSHAVFVMTLGQRHKGTGSKKASRMTLVDLAGSEKVSKTGSAGQTLREAQNINKSLSALGNVINALTCGITGKHVPYRDSKLTRLLTDSLGGNSKTCLIVTCSPAKWNATETVSTLRFGVRAKSIKNHAIVNLERSVEEYKMLLARAVRRVQSQQRVIRALQRDATTLRALLVEAYGGDESNVPALQVDAHAITAALAAVSTEGLDEDAAAAIESKDHEEADPKVEVSPVDDDDDDDDKTPLAPRGDAAAWAAERAVFLKERDAAKHTIEQLTAQQAQFQALIGQLDAIMSEFAVHKEKVRVKDEAHAIEVERLQAENARLHAALDEIRQQQEKDAKVVAAAAAEEPVDVDSTIKTPVVTPAPGRTTSRTNAISPQERVLKAAFQEKCEQYMNLQLAFQARMEHLTLVENALEETTDKLATATARLRQAEIVCEELTESGMYWREQRRLQEKKMLATKNLKIPMMGGGGRKLAMALRRSRQETVKARSEKKGEKKGSKPARSRRSRAKK